MIPNYYDSKLFMAVLECLLVCGFDAGTVYRVASAMSNAPINDWSRILTEIVNQDK